MKFCPFDPGMRASVANQSTLGLQLSSSFVINAHDLAGQKCRVHLPMTEAKFGWVRIFDLVVKIQKFSREDASIVDIIASFNFFGEFSHKKIAADLLIRL